jgi:hypothetical protein
VMAKWRALHESISRSEGLSKASHHDALFYTWGFPHADAHGLMRRSEAKSLVFPQRSTEMRVQRAIDWLIEHGKLCQQEHRGRAYIHWCWWDLYQGELARKGRGAPLFTFTCPNERRAIQRDTAEVRGSPRPTVTSTVTVQDITVQDNPPCSPPLAGGDKTGPTRKGRKPTRHRSINPRAAEMMALVRERMNERNVR